MPVANTHMTREEQETIIIGNADSREWEVCTADPKIQRKMERQGYKPNGAKNPWGYQSFTLPYAKITIRRAKSAQGKSPRTHSFPKQRDSIREKTT